MAATARLTPMLRHYLEVKAEHPDALLLYRMGDFYEMFFDDAIVAAPVLEIALTARQKGTDSEAPMCGVPHHALNTYLGRLVRAGYRVAICDQVEDPAEAQGLVKREVTRVVTPGTLSEPELLPGDESNQLCAIHWEGESGAGAFLDISTGRLAVHRWEDDDAALGDLMLQRPNEVLLDRESVPQRIVAWSERSGVCVSHRDRAAGLSARQAKEVVQSHFGTSTLRGFGLQDAEPAVSATAAALAYARHTQRSQLTHIRELRLEGTKPSLILDEATVRNLDLFRNQRDTSRRSTLIEVMDETRTAMGARLLREWLLRPLRERRAIEDRLDGVEELLADPSRREAIRSGLKRIGDLERFVSRAVLGSLTPREAAALRDSLGAIPVILKELQNAKSTILSSSAELDPANVLHAALLEVLADEPSAQLRKGGVIGEGVNPELDRVRSLARNSKQHILELETRERKATGISSLKVGFNRVFGYYFEVTQSHLAQVPEHYVRKQTLANAERYLTPEIKELEVQILEAEQRQLTLEAELFTDLVGQIVLHAATVQTLASFLAHLDGLANFAHIAEQNHYCRPRIGESGAALQIIDGRHPVLERALREEFVPNDLALAPGQSEIIILTGPNMGGKSTYLRQVALIVLMAQCGSYVPAARAEISVVDRIFTRVGASDDLARGESTFMVEMIEAANILRYATRDSLVVLDEVGRGTATFDGLSLAWAMVEYLHGGARPKTLFATHYHELTELAVILVGVTNMTLAVKEWEQKIIFLRRVIPGSADKSYGIHVARLAGLPAAVTERASEILANLERQEYDPRGRPRLAEGQSAPASEGADQMLLFTPPEQLVAEILGDVDVDRLTPLAALNLVQSLQFRLAPDGQAARRSRAAGKGGPADRGTGD